MKAKKIKMIVVLVLFVMVLSIGYAYLNTTLTINGTTDVDANTWNVYWNNIQVTSGSVTDDYVTTAPTIDTNKTTVSFQVRLGKPGDFYEFTVDAKNEGSIDAMVSAITKTTNVPNYLKYTVTYADDFAIEENHLLSSNTTQKYKIRVEYRTDINASDLPSTAQSTTLYFGVEYVQADNSAVVKPYYVYTPGSILVGTDLSTFMNSISESGAYYSFQEARNNYGNMIVRALIENDEVSEVSFAIYSNNKEYYLSAPSASSYSTNRELVFDAFDGDCEFQYNYYNCGDSNFGVSVSDSAVGGNNGSIHCEIYQAGEYFAFCGG